MSGVFASRQGLRHVVDGLSLRALGLWLLLLGCSSAAYAEFERVDDPAFEIAQSRPIYDRRTRTYYLDVTVGNTGSADVPGQFRLVVQNANKTALSSDGDTLAGEPYLELLTGDGAVFAAGGVINARLSFSGGRGQLVATLRLERDAPSDANQPPTARAGGDQTLPVGALAQLDGSASSDPDGDTLTFRWTLQQQPAESSSELTYPASDFNPTLYIDHPGSYLLSLVVNDGSEDSAPDEVRIDTVNSAPVADAGDDASAFVGDTVFLDGSGSFDIDDDPLDFTWTLLDQPAQSSANLSGADTDAASFTVDRAGDYEIELVVNDGEFDSEPDQVTISTANSAPVADAGPDLPADGDPVILPGDSVILDGSGSFDVDLDPLGYRWSFTTVPTGSTALIDDDDQPVASFSPDLSGTYIAQLIVNDGTVDSTPDTAAIEASDIPNSRPRITSTPVTDAVLGASYSYAVTATDDDVGDTLSYSLPLAPPGMTINDTSGLIGWKPASAGQADVQVKVTDSGGLSDSQSFQITVTAVNAPQLLPIGDRTIPAGDAFTTRLFAIDPDPGDTLTFGLNTAPDGMVINPSTGDLSWAPPAAGENTVTARVTDSTDRSDTQSFTVTVTEPFSPGSTNSPPTLALIADQTLTEGDTLVLTAEGSDPDDGDTLTYSLAAAPDGMTINPSTGAISWTATPPGAYDVTVLVEDPGGLVAAQAFIVTVEAINAAPTANDDLYIARRGETLVIPAAEGVLVNDTDPDGDALDATRLSDPTLGTLDSFNADGSFSYTPSEPSGITIGLQLKCETSLSDFVTSAGTASAADVDNDGDVELVGMSYFGLGAGVFVVDPTDCSAVASRIPDDSGQPLSDAVVTLVNLDDDPELEVVATYFRFGVDLVGSAEFGEDDVRLMAFELDGTPVAAWPRNGVSHKPAFETGFNSEWKQASPVAADLNGDGTPELLMGYTQVGSSGLPAGVCRAVVANTTCNAVVAWDGRTGTVLWTYIGGVTGPNQRSMTPTIVDLDMDGDTEIIWNQLVLDHEGNLVFELPVERTIFASGGELYGNRMFTCAVGNFDNDAFPEVVGYDERNFYLFSHDGGIQWQRAYNGDGFDFPWADLTLAELDGDPFPELVTMITGPEDAILTLRAFDSDGEPIWDQADDYAVPTFAQTRTSSAVAIDLDRDGIDELVQFKTPSASRGAGLYIIDGATGSIIDSVVDPALGVSNDRGDEPLTVADLDGDGSVEIVTNYNREFGFDRLQIWDNLPGEPFPPGRPIRSQTNVQPTWVNVDGSLPTSLEPHWLQPGRNYWNRIVPDLDPLAPERDSFTYRASDGEFDSAEATVNIEVRPNGNPPFFLSKPKRGTSAGISYSYQPLVIDVDPGDSVTFELLNGPAGMSIDPATGALDWYPESNGDYAVSIAATDTLGLSSAQIFTLTVGDPVVVPDVVGDTEAQAETALTDAGLSKGSVFQRSHPTTPAGTVIAQTPAAGAVADFGSAVELTLSTGPRPADSDDDSDGFSENEGDCNDADDSIYPGANDPSGDGIDQDCDGIDGALTLAELIVEPGESTVLVGQRVQLRATGVFEDGTAQNLTGMVTWSSGSAAFTPSAPGTTYRHRQPQWDQRHRHHHRR